MSEKKNNILPSLTQTRLFNQTKSISNKQSFL